MNIATDKKNMIEFLYFNFTSVWKHIEIYRVVKSIRVVGRGARSDCKHIKFVTYFRSRLNFFGLIFDFETSKNQSLCAIVALFCVAYLPLSKIILASRLWVFNSSNFRSRGKISKLNNTKVYHKAWMREKLYVLLTCKMNTEILLTFNFLGTQKFNELAFVSSCCGI